MSNQVFQLLEHHIHYRSGFNIKRPGTGYYLATGAGYYASLGINVFGTHHATLPRLGDVHGLDRNRQTGYSLS